MININGRVKTTDGHDMDIYTLNENETFHSINEKSIATPIELVIIFAHIFRIVQSSDGLFSWRCCVFRYHLISSIRSLVRPCFCHFRFGPSCGSLFNVISYTSRPLFVGRYHIIPFVQSQVGKFYPTFSGLPFNAIHVMSQTKLMNYRLSNEHNEHSFRNFI